jgi:hypothetical protein
MYRRHTILILTAALAGALSNHAVQAFTLGYSRGVKQGRGLMPADSVAIERQPKIVPRA